MKIYDRILSGRLRNSKISRFMRIFLGVEQLASEMAINDAIDFVNRNKIEGNYVEFGVSAGKTMAIAYHANRCRFKINEGMSFFGFDSFKGLPEASKIDKGTNLTKGRFANTKEQVTKNLTKAGVVDFRLIDGWYHKVLPKFKYQWKMAIVHIDCDYYKSTVPCLKFITPHIQDGTIIIFNDWFLYNGYKNKGEQKAFNDWLRRNKHISAVELGTYKGKVKAFILHKSTKRQKK